MFTRKGTIEVNLLYNSLDLLLLIKKMVLFKSINIYITQA